MYTSKLGKNKPPGPVRLGEISYGRTQYFQRHYCCPSLIHKRTCLRSHKTNIKLLVTARFTCHHRIVSPQHGNCVVTLFWHLQFTGGPAQIFRKFVYPRPRPCYVYTVNSAATEPTCICSQWMSRCIKITLKECVWNIRTYPKYKYTYSSPSIIRTIRYEGWSGLPRAIQIIEGKLRGNVNIQTIITQCLKQKYCT